MHFVLRFHSLYALQLASYPKNMCFSAFGSNLCRFPRLFRTYASHPNILRWDMLGLDPVQTSSGVMLLLGWLLC